MVPKSVRKGADKAWLEDTPPDKVFWCCDGRVVNNMGELASAFREMPDETFRCHVTSEKNDFHNWVRDVIGDLTLADNLLRATTKTAAAQVVERRLFWLRARISA